MEKCLEYQLKNLGQGLYNSHCVITKDLLRFGENYIEAGIHIEIFFPKHNVRYIAITDGWTV